MQRRQHRIDEDAEDESADQRGQERSGRECSAAHAWPALLIRIVEDRRYVPSAHRRNEASARPLGRQPGCRLLPSAMRAAVRACMVRCELVGKRLVRYWLAFVVSISLHGTQLATTKEISQVVTDDVKLAA